MYRPLYNAVLRLQQYCMAAPQGTIRFPHCKGLAGRLVPYRRRRQHRQWWLQRSTRDSAVVL